MVRKLTPEDVEVWNTFVKKVSQTGEPEYNPPSLYIAAPLTELDLHGLTLSEAHRYTMDFVDGASGKYVMVITGLSGQIKKEFPHWFSNHKTVRQIEEMNGGGAYKIHFKKKLTKRS